jgi:hypothetical protein
LEEHAADIFRAEESVIKMQEFLAIIGADFMVLEHTIALSVFVAILLLY